jgi:ribosomal-protein-alanine N-acetyltransferase
MILPDSCELSTARLLLRTLRPDDATPLFALFNNWNVIRFLSAPPWPYSPGDSRLFVNGVVARSPGLNEEVLAITQGGTFIGVISVRQHEPGPLQRGAGPNIGYWVGEPFWGHGFMSEALAALVAHIFGATDTDAIYSGAFMENVASLRVQEKVGFIRDGDSTLFSRPRNGDFPHVNTVLMRARFASLAKDGSPSEPFSGGRHAGRR